MSNQEAAWYYSQHGERKGPVTLEVLKGAVAHMKVDRETDLVWGPGLANWVKVSEVPELKDVAVAIPQAETAQAAVTTGSSRIASAPAATQKTVEQTPVKAAQTTSENPYQAPKSLDDDSELADAMAARRQGGGAAAGLGRVMYFVLQVVLYAVFLGIIFALLGSQVDQAALKEGDVGAALTGVLVASLVYLIGSLWTTFSRLKNLGMSRWNILWSFVPFMNIWLGFRLCACPAGYQTHRKLDLGGKIVLALYILFFVLYLAAVGVSAATTYKEAADEAQRVIDLQNSEQIAE